MSKADALFRRESFRSNWQEGLPPIALLKDGSGKPGAGAHGAASGHAMVPVCRNCGSGLTHVMADLGMQPIANDYPRADDLNRMEPFYPLRALVCDRCFLVQAQEFESAQHLFASDYAYFSSYSDSFVAHARDYAHAAITRFGLTAESHVVEVACNDGYLLKWFREAGVPVLGIEPTASTAKVARDAGIPVEMAFFGRESATRLRDQGFAADLMPANNVVAHVPDIHDFIDGFRILLKPAGVASFEFHHLLNLLRRNQFDTIYHEHYYYHSLRTFQSIVAQHGLQIFDVEERPTHGGSLRVYLQNVDTGVHPVQSSVARILAEEARAGLDTLAPYLAFEQRVRAMKRELLAALIEAKARGKQIVAYGAPAKGNTLLNYAGVRSDFIDYTVDRNPHKQNRFLPGVRIPILAPEQIMQTRPDLVLVLCWNLIDEVAEQMAGIREWGGRFMVAIPTVRIL